MTSILGGCEAEFDDQEELQALLRDEPIELGAPQRDESQQGVGGGEASVLPPGLLGAWEFDDCNSGRTQLADSTFNGNTAYRAVAAQCTTGIRTGQGVQIMALEDIVYVPDQPNFTFENGVTVAGWFRPNATGGTKTLFRKRDNDTSSFALMLNSGKFQFVVNLGNGQAISVASLKKATVGVYQHVAATWDNSTARLYVDGFEVNSFTVPGTMPNGPGPLLMGNDGSERRYNGSLDAMVFTTHALTAAEVAGLTCFPVSPSMTLTPASIVDQPPGVPATFDVAVKNNNSAACTTPIVFSMHTHGAGFGLELDPPPFVDVQSAPVASGQTGHLTITATPDEDAEPGTFHFIDAHVFESTTGFSEIRTATLTVGEPTGCNVSTRRELMIRDVSVVDDPIRTVFNPGSSDPRNGVWTFKHLVEEMAPTPAEAPAMVEAMIASFTTAQTINGQTVAARPGMNFILSVWPRDLDGQLDLAQAPLRLLAIVNRFDLRDLAAGDAGEGRFVFGFNDGFFPFQATLIVEYKLPAATDAAVLAWAQAFHGLGALPFGEGYNAALQAVTEQFVGRDARPGAPNGSALNALRTNEIHFGSDGQWELREFHLSATTGMLEPVPVALTPRRTFNNTGTLASFITANEPSILLDRHTVPLQLNGQAFQAGAIFNNLGTWFAPGIASETRHHFAVNTCNGCHSTAETGTFFLQIGNRFPFSEAQLAGFLTGITVSDPQTSAPRTFDDLARRKADLEAIVCAQPGALATPKLRKGISRVH